MIVVRPVLEMYTPDGFDLWPVADREPFTFLALGGALSSPEVGSAVMRIAACNDMDPDELPLLRAGAVESFLRGLLTCDPLFAAGGLRVTDTTTGVTFLPGCCDGLEDWRAWYRLAEADGALGFGHEPVSPLAERLGDTLRLTVDAERSDSPVIEFPVTDLRPLLAGVERDLSGFLVSAAAWASLQLPDHADSLTAALARVLAILAPGASPDQWPQPS
ncbi:MULTISPECIES: hypothetical protein [unclassified Streptomyces]|uniref:hypothetical protein n=1 Tax=unclassified Streptomyces TaxID=2593676 RepID=UPI003681F3CF